MGYVTQGQQYYDPQMEGFFSAIGGALKKAGGFVAKKVAPTIIGAVPIVGGVARRVYEAVPGVIQRRPGYPTPILVDDRVPLDTPGSFVQRAGRIIGDEFSRDPRLRDLAVGATSRLPAPLLTAAAARQARDAPAALKAGLLLPALAVGAFLLARRR